MPKLQLPNYDFRLSNTDSVAKIFCTFRGKWVVLTPEEWVRQHFGLFMVNELKYPKSRMKLEQQIIIAGKKYKADIAVYNPDMQIDTLVECKRPEVKITQEVFRQIGIYNHGLKGVDKLFVTNGLHHYALANSEEGYIFLSEMPEYSKEIGKS